MHVIVLTGSPKCRKEDALEAGADDFIEKPFSPLTLIDKIEQILKD